MKLREVLDRVGAARKLVEQQEHQWKRILAAREAAQNAGVWTDAVKREFDREAERAFRRLTALRRRLNALLAVEVDEKALEDAWGG